MAAVPEVRPALIVEDERAIRDLLALHLASAGFTVGTVADGSTALRLLQEKPFELVVLDVMLPGVDGVSICQRVRASGPNATAAILMVTARDTEADKVRGLESGADDYIAKPFAFEELLARVRLRLRADRQPEVTVLRVADLALDLRTRRAYIGERSVDLSTREFALAEVFCRHPDQVLTREQLLSHVWGFDFDPGSNVVDVYVRYLRRKIGADRIETVRGTGYRLRAG